LYKDLHKIATFATILYPEQGHKTMNKDAETAKSMLERLLEPPPVLAPSGKSSDHRSMNWEDLKADLQPYIDPLDSEPLAVRLGLVESSYFLSEDFSFFEPGETPAVQDRFHSLLKHRLRQEIELKPPVFPWETEGYEYDADLADAPDLKVPDLGVPTLRVPAAPVGALATQLRSLQLPTPIPENVLAHIFSKCQGLIQSSFKEGERLVKAVETLFPGHAASLNQLAPLVLDPSRSPRPNITLDYATATLPQQMALALIAANEIIESLTLKVAAQPVERQWPMSAGALKVVAEYQAESNCLRVEGQLPSGAQVNFRGSQAQVTTQRSDAGRFSVELFDVQVNHAYVLDVQLHEPEQGSVIFSIHPMAVH
jgi:hypothetical protein